MSSSSVDTFLQGRHERAMIRLCALLWILKLEEDRALHARTDGVCSCGASCHHHLHHPNPHHQQTLLLEPTDAGTGGGGVDGGVGGLILEGGEGVMEDGLVGEAGGTSQVKELNVLVVLMLISGKRSQVACRCSVLYHRYMYTPAV
jgi:hypothetical protein